MSSPSEAEHLFNSLGGIASSSMVLAEATTTQFSKVATSQVLQEVQSALSDNTRLSMILMALMALNLTALCGILVSLQQTRNRIDEEQADLTDQFKELKRGLKREQLFKTLTIEI